MRAEQLGEKRMIPRMYVFEDCPGRLGAGGQDGSVDAADDPTGEGMLQRPASATRSGRLWGDSETCECDAIIRRNTEARYKLLVGRERVNG